MRYPGKDLHEANIKNPWSPLIKGQASLLKVNKSLKYSKKKNSDYKTSLFREKMCVKIANRYDLKVE